MPLKSILRSKKRQTQVLATLIVCIFFTIGGTLLSKQEEETGLNQRLAAIEEPSALVIPEKPASVSLEKFTRKSTTNGKIAWEITGSTVNVYNEDDLAEIQMPILTLHREEPTPVVITAKSALVNFIGQEIKQADLNEDVVLKNTNYQVETNHAEFYQSKNLLIAPGNVKIFSEQLDVTGEDLTSHTSSEINIIKKNTKSTIRKQASSNKKKSAALQVIKVSSDRLDFNNKSSKFKYSGNVIAKDGTHQIDADILSGRFTETQELTDFVANGNVIITDKEGLETKSDRADFDLKTNDVVLSGNPELMQNNNLVKAEIIYYNTATGKSHAEGEVEVTLLEK